MVYHLFAVNMIWKLQHATNPDEEKKKMIEFDTTTSTNNISSNNYINSYNFYSNESPTCLSKGFQMENLKMTIDVLKKWKEDKKHQSFHDLALPSHIYTFNPITM